MLSFQVVARLRAKSVDFRCIMGVMSHETVESAEKPSKTTGEKLAAVEALLSAIPDLGPAKACRRVGLPIRTYYWHLEKRGKNSPASNASEPGETGPTVTLSGSTDCSTEPDGGGTAEAA